MQPPPVGFCTVCSMRSRVMHSARVRVTHNNSAESCMYDRLHNFNLIKPDNSRALFEWFFGRWFVQREMDVAGKENKELSLKIN